MKCVPPIASSSWESAHALGCYSAAHQRSWVHTLHICPKALQLCNPVHIHSRIVLSRPTLALVDWVKQEKALFTLPWGALTWGAWTRCCDGHEPSIGIFMPFLRRKKTSTQKVTGSVGGTSLSGQQHLCGGELFSVDSPLFILFSGNWVQKLGSRDDL